jgi:hypothetical protein
MEQTTMQNELLPLPEKPIHEAYWVLPGRLLAGEYPANFSPRETVQRLQRFLRQGFDLFLDLTRPDELVPYEEMLRREAAEYGRSVHYTRFPIGDSGLPAREEMKAILDCLDETLTTDHKVYVHCRAGIGRTGTVIGCYLVRHGWRGAEALRRLQALYQDAAQSRLFPFSPETNAQREFILAWQPEW